MLVATLEKEEEMCEIIFNIFNQYTRILSQYVIKTKIISDILYIFLMLSSKSIVYFNLITNLKSEKPHFKCPAAIHGYHTGQHRSVPVESDWKLGGEWGEPGVSRKWPENGEESWKSGI